MTAIINHPNPKTVLRGEGCYLFLKDGDDDNSGRAAEYKVIDASGGAAVACLGHANKEVNQAMIDQMNKLSYVAGAHATTLVEKELAERMVKSTEGKMSHVMVLNSESAIKFARDYFYRKAQKEWTGAARKNFISREGSYHGNTLGALSASDIKVRREPYEEILLDNFHHVNRCYARDMGEGETDARYVGRLAKELDDKFEELKDGDNETVCAFIAEPVVGAAQGCVGPVPGYFEAMRKVCDNHGALLILDEVMCGMGRIGTLHAWQHEVVNVVPDIQTIGKGFGGGYQPVAAMMVRKDVMEQFNSFSSDGVFIHGHTYDGHAIACAAAREVLSVMERGDLLQNVRKMGELLGRRLKEELREFRDSQVIKDIRGHGLFWGIKFDEDAGLIIDKISELCGTREHPIFVYSTAATNNIIVAPPYIVTKDHVEEIIQLVVTVVKKGIRAVQRQG
ncbi:aminotransferase [Biscogniauxia marginata]|nr:aminotransferase [Biscogniauxia marginata]